MSLRHNLGYSNGWRGRLVWRVLTVADTLLMVMLLPLYVLWYGLSVLSEVPRRLHRNWKCLRTGRAGPYRGIVW